MLDNLCSMWNNIRVIDSKFKPGDNLLFQGRLVEVLKVDAFGSEPHYGVSLVDGDGNYRCGWVICYLIDALGVKIPG